MKTKKKSNGKLASPFKFTLYLFAFTVFCFTNWADLKASNSVDSNATLIEEGLSAVFEDDADPQAVLEDWMLSFCNPHLVEAVEEDLKLESWMLDLSANNITASKSESLSHLIW
jgi:hypothetical protein